MIKPLDAVDMMIIASFIYFVLIGARMARVRFIFIGIIFVGLVYILARMLGLYLTTVALQAFFAVFIVVLVIIFQDELRHLFERLAILGVAHNRSSRDKITFGISAEILISALASLNRKKTGALLVVKGAEPIDRYVEAGKKLDALLSQELIESIFEPHAPSHDGAVIIGGDRVERFGCHLPLSTNIKEVGRVGTRHAAGVGLSERTDALCVIVSEETGEISVAENGRLTVFKDLALLKDRIGRFYLKQSSSAEKKGLLGVLTAHSLEKVTAVFLAAGLWLAFAHPGETIRRYYSIPVEYRNLGPDVVIKEPKLKEVTVTLSGTEQKFNLLNPGNLKLSFDAGVITDGKQNVLLDKEMVRGVAGGLSIVDIEPDHAVVSAYRLLPQRIPVEVRTRGKISSSLILKDIFIDPKELDVLIPSTSTDRQMRAVTEPIDLGVINGTITLSPRLLFPPEARFVDNKPPEVAVTIQVEKQEGQAGGVRR